MTSPSQLYDAATGVLVGPVQFGDGQRQKAWLEEIPQMLQEFATTLKKGRLANFPAFRYGEGLGSKPIGESFSAPSFAGITLFEAVSQTAVLGTGDASAASFGAEALTQPDPTHADYLNTSTDPDDPPAPRGATFPAFIQTIPDAGGLDLQATNGVVTVEINGVAYSISGINGAAVVVENIRDAIITAGWPCNTAIEGGDTLRIWAPGKGVTSTLKVDGTAGTAGAALFTGANQSAAAGTTYRGGGGPLGQMDNTSSVAGAKPQRRILPGSISISVVAAAETFLVTDATITSGSTGVLSGANAAGTVTVAGTINYVTGAVTLTMTGDAPDNATQVKATWKALIPVKLEDPVRVQPSGKKMAILLN